MFLVVQYNKFKLFTEKDSFVFLVATSIKIIRALIYYNLRTDLSGLYIFKYVFMELFTKKKKKYVFMELIRGELYINYRTFNIII